MLGIPGGNGGCHHRGKSIKGNVMVRYTIGRIRLGSKTNELVKEIHAYFLGTHWNYRITIVIIEERDRTTDQQECDGHEPLRNLGRYLMIDEKDVVRKHKHSIKEEYGCVGP